MEIILNELSIDNQFTSLSAFIETGVFDLIKVIQNFSDDDILMKSSNLYSRPVTLGVTLYDALMQPVSRSQEEIRKVKLLLSRFFDQPYWEDNPRQVSSNSYVFNMQNVNNTSLAESCHREAVVISIFNENFRDDKLEVYVNESPVSLDNISLAEQLLSVKRSRGIIRDFSLTDNIRFVRTNFVRQGQVVFLETATGFYWYLDNFHRDHYEVFDSNGYHFAEADLNGNLSQNSAIPGRRFE